MGWDALAAIGSFGQFIVVLGAAFFGYAQLKQLRRQNELQATIPYFAFTRTDDFNRAFRIVRDEVLGVNEDETLRPAIARADNFFNELGVLVQEDMIDEATAVGFFRFQIGATWQTFRPKVANRRSAGVNGFMAPLEALAVRAAAFDESVAETTTLGGR